MYLNNEQLADLASLPLLRTGTRVRYTGSIDKRGGNADWDWYQYQDERGEWVIFEQAGPGCIFNLVQHRYTGCADVTFRFYFDGEAQPRFTIRHSQFGEVYPFIEPLASRYIGPPDARYETPIRVVRSYVPMPFRTGCRVTTDIRLEGNGDGGSGGGWGHILSHAYAEDAAEGIETFDPAQSVEPLVQLWKRGGGVPGGERRPLGVFTLTPGESAPLFVDHGAGLITGIELRTADFRREDLGALRLVARWDGHERPDLDAPLGCLCGNELGFHAVRYLLCGMDAAGGYYARYPMPYLGSARVELVNDSAREIRVEHACVTLSRADNALYAGGGFGYFRSAPYHALRHTEGADSIIGAISGHGHIVAATITGFGKQPDGRADCEGDVRAHIDGLRTPSVQSDGSESYASYGWGFATPPECHMAGGYDGEVQIDHKNWSMHRACLGEVYPFLSCARFGIESGGDNDVWMAHSGMVFYYGRDGVKLKRLCEAPAGGEALESYFEGDDDHVPVRARGVYAEPVALDVPLGAGVQRVILRRMSDQRLGPQRALVVVDGEPIEPPWYYPGNNPHKRWLEDEYLLPERVSAGKDSVRVQLIPEQAGGAVHWNVFGLTAYGQLMGECDSKQGV